MTGIAATVTDPALHATPFTVADGPRPVCEAVVVGVEMRMKSALFSVRLADVVTPLAVLGVVPRNARRKYAPFLNCVAAELPVTVKASVRQDSVTVETSALAATGAEPKARVSHRVVVAEEAAVTLVPTGSRSRVTEVGLGAVAHSSG